MERRKLTKEDIYKVRDIEGFPVGSDEDIIALSDAPFYTACPNPFIEEYIQEYGHPYCEDTDNYHREPFAADVSEGKNDAIYNTHSYHTKVPYKAIMRYILHYTEPNDLIFDGFSGSGMTGVAAHMCENPDNETKYIIETEMGDVSWGNRNVILNDLSPIATFISHNYNSKVDTIEYREKIERALAECEYECGWMYETNHKINTTDVSLFDYEESVKKGRINYTIWSDVFICPHCGEEIVFWDNAVDKDENKVKDSFSCPKCFAELKKKDCEHAVKSYYDGILNKTILEYKQVPVLINYTYNGKRYEKEPDENDLAIIDKIANSTIPYWYPTDRMCEGKESRRNDKAGITHVHHFYTKRNLWMLAKIYDSLKTDAEKYIFTAAVTNLAKTARYKFKRSGNVPLSGTLYIGSLTAETNPIESIRGKFEDVAKSFGLKKGTWNTLVNLGSTTNVPQIKNNSIDYIFTDPPFGSNLNYSELSFMWESWIGVKTNNRNEAIINTDQNKGLNEYQSLMESCFKEYYRVLKPNRWMTVEFHNSQNSVWNAIQESLQKAGFIIADVRTLDKKQDSFKQYKAMGAVKQDLVISAYKPKDSFRKNLFMKSGTEDTAWEFVKQHLANLPIVVATGNKIEIIPDRQSYLLFDRMVAYYIMNGLPVPIDATDFYIGLDARFLKRDEMYFLPNQINEYDTARITKEVEDVQFSLFINNEKTAIAWLYQQLDENNEGPQSYSELQPKFMKEAKTVEKFEVIPELSVLLEENFLKDEAGKWYVPDRTKEADVAKLREKNLWKEFEGYMNSKGKLKLFRSEAIRVGFARLWKDKNYQAIVEIAERLPEQIVQEDPNILMYYDISLSRV